MRWKAICVPSGDHTGTSQSEGWLVRRNSVSLPKTFTYRCKPGAPAFFHANAILDPSGENAGAVSSPGRTVKGTTRRLLAAFVAGGCVERKLTTASSAIAAARPTKPNQIA